MARLLHSKGYEQVRPLLGGFDAWVEKGYPVEPTGGVTVPLVALAAPSSAK